MPKDLLAFVDATFPDAARTAAVHEKFLPYAIALAESWGAHLTVAVTTAIPGMALYPAHHPPNRSFAALRQDLLHRAGERLTQVETALAALHDRMTVTPLVEDVLLIGDHAAMLARYADLVLLPPPRAVASEWLRARITADVIQGSGRPALLVPDTDRPEPWANVVLAWSDTRECSSTWHDAAPLLPTTARIDIAVGCTTPALADAHGRPCARIVTHIRRQGFKASVQELSIHPAGMERQDPADILIRFARERDADLLIVSAGTTNSLQRNMLAPLARDVISRAEMPVFVSM